MKLRGILSFLFLSLLLLPSTFSQTQISGIIKDIVTSEPIIGAQITISNSLDGTLSDAEGRFSFSTQQESPYTIECSAFGYKVESITLNQAETGLDILLFTDEEKETDGVIVTAPKVEDIVVSASKFKERKMEAPVTTHKLGLLSLRDIPVANIHGGLDFLPEVQTNSTSLTFQSLNTRGFANTQNYRFVTIIDGVDVGGPAANYPLMSLVGSSELDLSHLELVVGPGSALYGPNALNGVLVMNTKSPFDHQGISALVKSGVTVQEAGGTNPYNNIAFRYAKAFNDKFAIKANLDFLKATDWATDDQSHLISNPNVWQAEALLERPRSHPNFDAVSMYGDEIAVPVDLGLGTPIMVNRTGISEKDIIDYSISNLKLDVGLHYRINSKTTGIYTYKFGQGDAILRDGITYPLRGVQAHIHQLELKSEDFYVRGYYSSGDGGNSYYMLTTGAFIQEGLKASDLWSQEYGAAFRGEIPDVIPADHEAARNFADRDIPGANSTAFQQLRALTLENPDVSSGGSKFGDNSSLIHFDANYDLSKKIKFIDLQFGASLRRYRLNSAGNLFNDGAQGFNGPIPILEYGAYAQGTKQVLGERLTFRASARIDKNQNFKARITPRFSAIYALDKDRNHILRFSTQTGFRNPGSQESYSAIDLSQVIVLGGTEDNVNHYDYMMPSEEIIDGNDIYDQLVTLGSFQEYAQTGFTDPSVLEPMNLAFLKQENIRSIELGYKGRLTKEIELGLNIYANTYRDLSTIRTGFSLLTQRLYAVYTNINDPIRSAGATFQLQYELPKGYILQGNYSVAGFNADSAVSNNPEFLPSFNLPRSRINISFNNRDVFKGIGFSFRFRWLDSYIWQSPVGQGEIQSYSQLDGAIRYQIPKYRAEIKLGGSNLLNREYLSTYGGPQIGSLYYVSLMIDGIGWK